jgi:hypothetical protein
LRFVLKLSCLSSYLVRPNYPSCTSPVHPQGDRGAFVGRSRTVIHPPQNHLRVTDGRSPWSHLSLPRQGCCREVRFYFLTLQLHSIARDNADRIARQRISLPVFFVSYGHPAYSRPDTSHNGSFLGVVTTTATTIARLQLPAQFRSRYCVRSFAARGLTGMVLQEVYPHALPPKDFVRTYPCSIPKAQPDRRD